MASTAVARERFFALRDAIAAIEGRLPERLALPGIEALPPHLAGLLRQSVTPLGIETFDAALGGGLPRSGLLEVHSQAVRDGAAAAGFALAASRLLLHAGAKDTASGPLLWIATAEMAREAGRPYLPGLAARFGLTAEALLFAEAPRPVDCLWMAEEAANAGIFSSVLVELRGAPQVLDLTATRRLHRRAQMAGHPLFLIRHSAPAEPTAAPLRLIAAPIRSRLRHTLDGPLSGSIGPPAFRIVIDKSRTAIPATACLEWSNHAFHDISSTATDSRSLVPLPAGGATSAAAARSVLAFPTEKRRPARVQPPGEQYPARRGA